MVVPDYKPIAVDCIIPGSFPAVDLYSKGTGENYILYKPCDRPFTDADRERLQRGGKDTLYVDGESFRNVVSYLEENLPTFVQGEGLTEHAKHVLLSQITTELVAEAFAEPQELGGKLDRCRNVTVNLLNYITTNGNVPAFLANLSAGKLYILEHSVKVAVLTMLVHLKLFSLDEAELLDIGVGSLLHDVGMTFLSGEILEKPEALSNIEYDLVKKHSLLGYDLIKRSGVTSEILLTVVKHHHEHWDGGGYPDRLRGDNIPCFAQVAAICDVYSALTSDRPHRKASSHAETLQMMQSEAGNTFNAELFAKFKTVVSEWS